MKSLILVVGALFIYSPAQAEVEGRGELNMQACVATLKQRMSEARAKYACQNPFLDSRATDTLIEERFRQELAQERADDQAEAQRIDHQERGE